jgi:hypothetical protein
VKAFGEIVKRTNTVVVPANPADASFMVTQALAVFRRAQKLS